MSEPESSPLKIAMIGCGRPLRTEGATGFGMAHRHMAGYAAYGNCTLTAVVDLNRGNAEAFIGEHNPKAAIFPDSVEMMEAIKPDVVSICLWPHLHAEVVCAIAPFKPKVIFCEKPMDSHWGACLRMHAACEENGVLLSINHQRRFNLPLAKAKALIDAGAIGKLQRMDGAWHNLSDAGTHVLDMLFFYNKDTPAEWVLGQIDMRGSKKVFGGLNAGHGVSEIRFTNGVRATYSFGLNHEDLGCLLRLTGGNGVIEILFDEPWLRMRTAGRADWEIIDTGENIHDDKAIYRGIADILDSLGTNRVPQLSSTNALRPTEIIFATHESARRRGRVDLPLPPGPCAMLRMLEEGELTVELED
jgi:predicted dehydrogenase